MPIISSLGALAYPKITGTYIAPNEWATSIQRTGITLYTREGATSGVGSVDEYNVVCVDYNGNLYIHASTLPTTGPYVNATRYLIQLDSATGDIGSFLYPVAGNSQGFTAINPIAPGNNDVFFPFDQYISGSGSSTIIQNALEKTSAGIGATGYDVGSGSVISANLKRFESGKNNQDGMFLLSYITTQVLAGSRADSIGYGCTGITCRTTVSGQLQAKYVKSCVSPSGEVVMSLINDFHPYSGSNDYSYIGNVTSGWSFQTEWQVDDMVADNSYIYAVMSRTSPSTLGKIVKIDITTGTVIDAIELTIGLFTNHQNATIIFGDDGFLYFSGSTATAIKLDTSLNVIDPTTRTIGFTSGVQNFYSRNIMVRNGMLSGTFAANTGQIIAYRIINDNTPNPPGSWGLGGGSFTMGSISVTSASYPTSNIVFTTIDAGRFISFVSGATFSGTYPAPTTSIVGTVDFVNV